eukprot:8932027-Pyramimonas_sp.AAC.1
MPPHQRNVLPFVVCRNRSLRAGVSRFVRTQPATIAPTTGSTSYLRVYNLPGAAARCRRAQPPARSKGGVNRFFRSTRNGLSYVVQEGDLPDRDGLQGTRPRAQVAAGRTGLRGWLG